MKHISIHNPKYWKSNESKLEKGLKIRAIIGRESLIAIDDDSSIP